MIYNNEQKICYMMDFTRIYKQYSNTNIYEREAKCLEQQLMFTMLPLREYDLIAGRKCEMPIGFSPQAYDSVGYYCDNETLIHMKKDSSLSEDMLKNVNYLIDFWRNKTTKEKIIAKYTQEQKELLTQWSSATEKGTGFPLYRMAGAQMNPEKLLNKGIGALLEEVTLREDNSDFFFAVKLALNIFQKLCLRYSDEALEMAKACNVKWRADQLFTMADNLSHISFYKPETFWQAMQMSYLFFLISGTFNYGRLDEYLGSYFVNDVDNCFITEDFALNVTKNLWSLIIERNTIWDGRIILGGKDRKNVVAADRFALLALDASEQTKDVLPQLTLRCHQGMNEVVYNRALELIGKGTTYPILYNDDCNIPAVSNAFCIDLETAESYVPFGCGEYVIYNKSFGTPSGALNLLQCLNSVIYDGENLLESSCDFETFYNSYIEKLDAIILILAQQEKLEYDVCAMDAPFLYFSILFDDCLEKGKAVFDGGIRYLGGTLECYGNTNTSDSLAAIKRLVFDEKLITAHQLTEALQDNFLEHQEIQQLLLSSPKYGNDDDYADEMGVRLHDDLCERIKNCGQKVNLHSYLGVMINNSMNTTFGLTTGASADGRLANSYMANANNPTGGMDKNGVTAMLNSLVKLKTNSHAGSVQNMRFARDMFTTYLTKTKALLHTYFLNGGSQAMITVLNRGDLENALAEPEKYQNLIVRVGGFSARFVELSPDVQKELLSRTLY